MTEDNPLFLKHAEEFLNLSQEQMKDAIWLREANLAKDVYDAKEKISCFKQSKVNSMFVNDLIFAAFDMFNVNASFDENKTVEH